MSRHLHRNQSALKQHMPCTFIATTFLSVFAGANAPHTLAVPCDEGSWRGRGVHMAALKWAAPFLSVVG